MNSGRSVQKPIEISLEFFTTHVVDHFQVFIFSSFSSFPNANAAGVVNLSLPGAPTTPILQSRDFVKSGMPGSIRGPSDC